MISDTEAALKAGQLKDTSGAFISEGLRRVMDSLPEDDPCKRRFMAGQMPLSEAYSVATNKLFAPFNSWARFRPIQSQCPCGNKSCIRTVVMEEGVKLSGDRFQRMERTREEAVRLLVLPGIKSVSFSYATRTATSPCGGKKVKTKSMLISVEVCDHVFKREFML